jgi:hypothetical protein
MAKAGCMDAAETVVETYLRQNGYSDIVFEPDGNVSPDFLINGRVAVEVRRLNAVADLSQTDAGANGLGIEEMESNKNENLHELSTVAISVERWISQLCEDLGPPGADGSYFVNYKFERPVTFNAQVKKLVCAKLQAVNGVKGATKIFEENGLSVEIVSASKPLEKRFNVNESDDQQAVLWEIDLSERSLKWAIEEKENRTKGNRPKHPTWWLILVDYIGFLKFDAESKPSPGAIQHTFDRVIVIDPIAGHSSWDYHSSK